MASPTPAQFLVDLQRKQPPIYQRPDGGKALFLTAVERASRKTKSRVAQGMIVGGEVGDLDPVAYVTPAGSGYAIVMHSGLMRLTYSAARAMFASDPGKFLDDKPKAPLTAEQIAAKV